MNVSELFDLTAWIESNIEDTSILGHYQNLASALQRCTNPNQQSVPFESERETLIDAIKIVPTECLSKDQLIFLENLGLAEAVGERGAENLEKLLFRNVLDLATSATKVGEIATKIQSGINKAKQIAAGLDGCVDYEGYESKGEVLVRVVFANNAKMSNISDFKEWGKTWYEIGRGIALAHNGAPEEIKVVGATRGSIVIELSMVATYVGTASGLIIAALKVVEKIMDLKLKSEQIRELKPKNNTVERAIEEEIQTLKKESAAEIASESIKNLGLKKGPDGEKIVALTNSVSLIVDFLERGGEVDFVPPDPEAIKDNSLRDEIGNLRIAFQDIRRLEHKIHCIEFKE